MTNNVKAGGLKPLDSIFGNPVSESKAANNDVKTEARLDELHPFKNHPYQVREDAAMLELANSIKENGVLYPAIVRPRAEGGYELIAGHRRKHACGLVGISSIPIDIRDVDDDTATLMMVNSNFQREKLLPSEKAFAYKMMLDALKRQGKRNDLTSAQFGPKLGATAAEAVAEKMNDSKNQVKRYIRLTQLVPIIMNMVDNEVLPVNAGVELSFLGEHEQGWIVEVISKEAIKVSLSQASELKTLSQNNVLTMEMVVSILTRKAQPVNSLSIPKSKIKQYFPKNYTVEQMQKVVFELLEQWKELNEIKER